MSTRDILIDTKIEALEDIVQTIQVRIAVLKGMKDE